MAKQIVFSDLHFGSPTCSLRKETINKKLLAFLREQGEIGQLILAGDILDANISSLTQAIEGRKDSGPHERFGFRKWLAYLFEQDSLDVEEIVYVPGTRRRQSSKAVRYGPKRKHNRKDLKTISNI
jgi:hypothetical protein